MPVCLWGVFVVGILLCGLFYDRGLNTSDFAVPTLAKEIIVTNPA